MAERPESRGERPDTPESERRITLELTQMEAQLTASALEFLLRTLKRDYETYDPELDASGIGLDAAFESQRQMGLDIEVSKQLLAKLSEFAK